MKIQILKENLAKTISLAVKFAPAKAQLPILGNVLIEANARGIFVTATSLDVGVRLRMAGKILNEGAVAVPARLIGELVQSLPLGGIVLETLEDGELLVSGQRMKAKLQTIKPEDFPPFPEAASVVSELSVDQLVKEYERIGFAVSTDESRPILTGFLWHWGKGLVVATDGYRLSLNVNKKAWEVEAGKELSLVVPGKAMVQLLQVFSELKLKKIKFGYSEVGQQLLFISDEVTGMVRVLTGEFPKYEGILPTGLCLSLTVNREQFLAAVRSAAIFARDSANIVKLVIRDHILEVSANAAQVGENVVEVEVEMVQTGAGTIAFNSKFLVDFLTHVSSDRIGFGMSDPLKPGLFTEVGAEEYKHVIMPVRVRE